MRRSRHTYFRRRGVVMTPPPTTHFQIRAWLYTLIVTEMHYCKFTRDINLLKKNDFLRLNFQLSMLHSSNFNPQNRPPYGIFGLPSPTHKPEDTYFPLDKFNETLFSFQVHVDSLCFVFVFFIQRKIRKEKRHCSPVLLKSVAYSDILISNFMKQNT